MIGDAPLTQVQIDEELVKTTQLYRGLFFDMQDKFFTASDKVEKQRIIMARQRDIIRRLEAKLGIDQEL